MTRARRLLDLGEFKSPEEIADKNQSIYLTGNPPKGGTVIRQFAVTPAGTEFYAEEANAIAEAYNNLPVCDQSAVPLWEALGKVCNDQASLLRAEYNILQCDEYDPYATADDMLQDIATGTFRVTSLHSDHPVWNVHTNVDFRIVHDLRGHGMAGSDFSLHGEVLAYQAQCSITPEELWPVLFTEIVGQLCWASVHHLFGPQKVGLIMLDQDEIDRHVDKVLMRAESLKKQSKARKFIQ